MRKKVLTAMSAALLMVTAMAFAQPGPGGPNGPMAGPGPDGGLIEFLGLDDAQIEAWTAFHDEFRATVEPIHETMRDLQTQLREALDADAPDASVVGQLMLDIEAVRAEIHAAREALDENLKSILTAEQLLKFDAFRAAQAHMRRGPGAGGPGGGPGPGPGGGKGLGGGNGAGPRG